MKINFYSLFRQYPNGIIEPIRMIRIAGLEFGPKTLLIYPGYTFAGVDISLYVGKDFRVHEDDGVCVITGIYAD